MWSEGDEQFEQFERRMKAKVEGILEKVRDFVSLLEHVWVHRSLVEWEQADGMANDFEDEEEEDEDEEDDEEENDEEEDDEEEDDEVSSVTEEGLDYKVDEHFACSEATDDLCVWETDGVKEANGDEVSPGVLSDMRVLVQGIEDLMKPGNSWANVVGRSDMDQQSDLWHTRVSLRDHKMADLRVQLSPHTYDVNGCTAGMVDWRDTSLTHRCFGAGTGIVT